MSGTSPCVSFSLGPSALDIRPTLDLPLPDLTPLTTLTLRLSEAQLQLYPDPVSGESERTTVLGRYIYTDDPLLALQVHFPTSLLQPQGQDPSPDLKASLAIQDLRVLLPLRAVLCCAHILLNGPLATDLLPALAQTSASPTPPPRPANPTPSSSAGQPQPHPLSQLPFQASLSAKILGSCLGIATESESDPGECLTLVLDETHLRLSNVLGDTPSASVDVGLSGWRLHPADRSVAAASDIVSLRSAEVSSTLTSCDGPHSSTLAATIKLAPLVLHIQDSSMAFLLRLGAHLASVAA